MSTDPTNEKFNAFEIGLNSRSNDGSMAAKLNFYSTSWNDRIQTRQVQNPDGDDIIVYLTGINQNHSGIEFELAAQLHEMVRLDFGVGLGNWEFTDDASGTYRDGDADESYSYALKGMKVGDMPQTNIITGLTLTPIEGLRVNLLMRTYMGNYSDWSISGQQYSEGDEVDRWDSWQAPDYSVVDIHAYYDLPVEFGPVKPELYLHVFNALDAVYIQDATNNSPYNSWESTGNASDAEVYFGLPMSFNIGLKVGF